MKSLTDLQEECVEAVHGYIDKANQKWGERIRLKYPSITFDLRGRKVAGLAWPGQNRLQLHNDYILERPDYYVEQVAGHEAAHLIAHLIWARSPFPITAHGDEWQQVMWQLGLPATRCWRSGDAPAQAMKKKEIVTPEGRVKPHTFGKIIEFD